MNWLETQMATLAAGAAGFALNWLIQSTLLIAAGLALASYLRGKGSAVQSLIYRTTLAAVLICPLATWGLGQIGVSGWSIAIPAGFTCEKVNVVFAASTPPQVESITPTVAASDADADTFSVEGKHGESLRIPYGQNPRIAVTGDVEESVSFVPAGSPSAYGNSNENAADISVASMNQPATAAPDVWEYNVTWFGVFAPFALAIWLIGSGYFLGKLITSWWRMSRLVQSAHVADESTREFCHQLASELNVRSPSILRSPFIPSPCLAGLGITRRPSILLPDDELNLPMRDVLVHELAHLRRHDCHWNLLRQLATAVYFFQPLLWILSRRIEISAEEVCDDFVVQSGGDRRYYASRLVDIAELSTEFSAAAVAAAGVGIVSLRSMLARRVERIMDTSRGLSTRVGNLLLVAVLLCGLTGTAIVGLVGLNSPTHGDEAVVEAVDEQGQEAKSKNDQQELAVVEDGADSKAADAESYTYAGNVVGTDGKPVDGADIYFVNYAPNPTRLLKPSTRPSTTTGADGGFSFTNSFADVGPNAEYGHIVAVKEGAGFAWSLSTQFQRNDNGGTAKSNKTKTLRLTEDHPIKGRIVDIDGQPVVGAKLTLLRVFTSESDDLRKWNRAVKEPDADFYSSRGQFGTPLHGPQVHSLVKPAVTDADGKFVIRGVGKERIARFLLEGPNIETERIYIRTELGEKVTIPQEASSREIGVDTYYAAQLEHVSGPSIPITGIVRTADTQQPLAGVTIKSQRRHGHMISGLGEDFVRAVTDEDGRYRLEGMPIGKENEIAAIVPQAVDASGGPDKDQIAYVHRGIKVSTEGEVAEVTADIELYRGVWLHGRVTDAKTGKGLAGTLEYHIPSSNPNSKKMRDGVDLRDLMLADANGHFRFPVLPGAGFVSVQVNAHDEYGRAATVRQIDGTEKKAKQMINARPSYLVPANFHMVAEFNAGEGNHDLECNLPLRKVQSSTVAVVGPDGQPVSGFYYTGHGGFSSWKNSKGQNEFELTGYSPTSPRHVYVAQPTTNLAGYAKIEGDLKDQMVIKLVKGCTVTGRIVDEDGDPVANHRLIRWSASVDPDMEEMASFDQLPPLPFNADDKRRGENMSDEEGRFTISCLVPDVDYRIAVPPVNGEKYIRSLDVVINLDEGESKDLGDLTYADSQEFERRSIEMIRAKARRENLSIIGSEDDTLLASSPVAQKKAAAAERDIAFVAQKKTAEGTPATNNVHKSPEEKSHTINTAIALPNGNPAADTHVALTGYDRETGEGVVFADSISDEKGNCVLEYRGGKHDSAVPDMKLLIARKKGHAIGWEMLGGPVGKSDAGETIKIILHKQGLIKGRLVDIEGQPAAGEELQVQGLINPTVGRQSMTWMAGFRIRKEGPPQAWLQPVVTDDEGRFTLTGVPEKHGVYLALVDSKNFAPQNIALNTGQPEQRGPRDGTYRSLVKNVEPGEEAVLTLSPAKVITGTITYEDTKEPVANAKVSIWASQQKFGSMASVEGKTDAKGKYRILPKPGIRFGVSAYPPAGAAYMARKAEDLDWENSDTMRTVDIQLPKVTLVKGRVVEEGTGKSVTDATITFEGSGKYAPENAITGWQAQQTSDADGNFTYAVPPGRGTLVVRKRDSHYVLQTMESRKMTSGKSGGSRFYANAFHVVDVEKGQEKIDATIEVKPGKTVYGIMVDEEGKPIEQAAIITRLKVWDLAGGWRGDSNPNIGSKFELTGLAPEETYKVHFLDAGRKLGATIDLKATDEEVKVVLRPCGSATARFIVEDEEQRSNLVNKSAPTLTFVLTSGAIRFDLEAMRAGKVSADADFNANIDRVNYGFEDGPKFDDDLRFTLPALIPGATYRLQTTFDQSWGYKEFTAVSGETLDLGVFTPKFDDE